MPKHPGSYMLTLVPPDQDVASFWQNAAAALGIRVAAKLTGENTPPLAGNGMIKGSSARYGANSSMDTVS